MILHAVFSIFFLQVHTNAGIMKLVDTVDTDEGVLVLTKNNFEQAILANAFLLVKFYAPWCGYCQKMAPEYANAAQYISQSGIQYIKLGKVDATIESDLAKKFGIHEYPTLKFFKSGQPIDYTGGRTKNSIIKWVLKKSTPVLTVLQPEEEFK